MAIIVTVSAGNPLAGAKFEIAGTKASRGEGLIAAIAAELGVAMESVSIRAPDVYIDGKMYATISEGELLEPTNHGVSTAVRSYIQACEGDPDTVLMMAFKACVKHGKLARGLSRAAVVNLVGNLYDAVAPNDE